MLIMAEQVRRSSPIEFLTMHSTAEVWRKIVHMTQRSLDMSQKPQKANIYRDKTVDQSPQLLQDCYILISSCFHRRYSPFKHLSATATLSPFGKSEEHFLQILKSWI